MRSHIDARYNVFLGYPHCFFAAVLISGFFLLRGDQKLKDLVQFRAVTSRVKKPGYRTCYQTRRQNHPVSKGLCRVSFFLPEPVVAAVL